MRLKRLYDHDAPKEEWVAQEEPCPTCDAKGVVVNEAGDGLANCPDCDDGTRRRQIPPVSGVEIEHYGPVQHFSPRIVNRGKEEGWLSLGGDELIIHGANKRLIYHVVRPPGRYGDEQINYYDCEVVREEDA